MYFEIQSFADNSELWEYFVISFFSYIFQYVEFNYVNFLQFFFHFDSIMFNWNGK